MLSVKAQYSVQRAFEIVGFRDLPYEAAKNNPRGQSVGVENPKDIIPNKLYRDFQGSDFVLAECGSELAPVLFAKFQVPDSDWILGAVAFGGATDLETTSLIVADKQGNITSTLEAEVQFGLIAAKQFRITGEGQVIITTLVPTAMTSVKFSDFKQISACKVDEIYSINSSGIFVKVSEQKSAPQTYSRSELDTLECDLWNL